MANEEQKPQAAMLKNAIGSTYLLRMAADIAKLRNALFYSERDIFPDRTELIRIYNDSILDSHLSAVWDQRRAHTLSLGYGLYDSAGVENEAATQILESSWFLDWMKIVLDSVLWGYELIEFGDIVNGNFRSVRRMPHHLVIPEHHQYRFFINMVTGTDYTQPPYDQWYMGIGKPDDLGLLLKASFHAISKRYVGASWDEFAMDFGMPTRVITSEYGPGDSSDKIETIDKVQQAGRGAILALPSGDKLELLQAQSVDAYKVYQENIAYRNAEISKLIIGQTMTTDNGSSRSQADVHQEVADSYSLFDAYFVASQVNEKLLPFLVMHGLVPDGLRFEWEDEEQISLKDSLDAMGKILTAGYVIDPEYIESRFGFPVQVPAAKVPMPNDTSGIVPEGEFEETELEEQDEHGGARKGKLPTAARAALLVTSRAVARLYPKVFDGHKHHSTCTCRVEVMNAKEVFSDDSLEQLVRDFYDKKYTKENLPVDVYEKIYQNLWGGAKKGLQTHVEATDDLDFMQSMRTNVAAFSAGKTYHQAREYGNLLLDDGGKVREWKDYKEKALPLAKDYNQTWLRTEYETAYASGQQASLWKSITADATEDTMLVYETVGDARVRQSHKDLDKITRPIGDEFWKTHYPPNGYRCRCTVITKEGGEATKDVPGPKDPLVDPLFRFNPGQKAMIFSPEHPYWDIPKADMELAAMAFGLPVEGLFDDHKTEAEKAFMETTIAKQVVGQITPELRKLKPEAMTEAEFVSVIGYTGKTYGPLNTELRAVAKDKDYKMTPELVAMSKVLIEAIKKLPVYEGPAVRMTTEAETGSWKVGGDFRADAYYSASMGNDAGAFKDKNVLINVLSKRGATIDTMSLYPDQKEVIFAPGTRFVITSVFYVGNQTVYDIEEI